MKKLFLFATALCLASVLNAQKNPIDELFDKYSEREGFTTIYISSKMFGLFVDKDAPKDEVENIMRRLKSIRILTVNDSLLNRDINFYNELSRKLDFSVYEELMVVKEDSVVMKFLIRQNGEVITELLVISGGPGGNVLISVKGDLDLKSISDLSKSSGIGELRQLDNIEKKQPED